MDTDPWARRTVRFGSLTEAREAVNDPRFLDSFFRVARCSMPRSCSRCWPAPCVHHSRSRALSAGVDDDAGRGRMGGQKRQFPYWSEVQPMEVRQRQAVGVQPELDPRYGIPRHAPSSLLDDADQVGSARSPGLLDHLCSARPCT